ncbi:MAG: hypothetical protein EOO70_02860 [Myxococcaceae bacterium]|nr:MAG: hypothetical protein EOO70_02860 [Myxococcaceae bacterium]
MAIQEQKEKLLDDTSPPAARPDDPGPNELGEIIAGLETLQAHPYVQGGLLVLKMYSAISDMRFQQRVLHELGWIRNKLEEIDRKVDQILSIVQRLPQIIQRSLDENTKKFLISEVRAKRRTMEVILANYADGGILSGQPFSAEHRQDIRRLSLEVIERAFQLSEWGEDAHVGVAFAYSVYLFGTRAISESPTDPHATRDRIKGLIDGSCDRLSEARARLVGAWRQGQSALAELDRTPRKLLLMNRSWYWYYADLQGNAATGFRMGPIQMGEPYDRAPRGYVWPQDAAPWLAGIRYADEGYVAGEVVRLMNAQIAARRKDLPPEELAALIESAKALSRAVAIV